MDREDVIVEINGNSSDSGTDDESSQGGNPFAGFTGRSSRLMKDDEEYLAEEDVPDKYKKSKPFSPSVILQWVCLILLLGALGCSLTIHALAKRSLWPLPPYKWTLIIIVFICGRLFSIWGVKFVVFFIERSFILRKWVLYFVYGLRKSVQNFLWLVLVLLAWQFYLLDENVSREMKDGDIPVFITKILIMLLVGTFLWLVKSLLIKVLASSFHVVTYFNRVQESLFTQYVIERLSGLPRETALPAMRKSGRIIGCGGIQNSRKFKSGRTSGHTPCKKEEAITIDELHRLNQKNISAWKMKRLMNIIRHGVITTLDEQIQDSCNEDRSATQIRSEFEAKRAAKKIFNKVAKPNSKFIHHDDIMRFMREEEAEKTMNQFEGAIETKRVSKKYLKNWVVNAFKERRALALTLDGTKRAVNQLHHMVNVVVGILIVVIGLLIFEIATTKFLVLVSSQLVLVAFMFGNTCKMVFEAIIFLFVMHPFDVGDRCEVEGVQMVVEEMNILTTVFLRYDNQKIIYPNIVLFTKPISNIYRSPDMGDAIDFCVHVLTPVEKISTMKRRLTA